MSKGNRELPKIDLPFDSRDQGETLHVERKRSVLRVAAFIAVVA